ncbi:MAG: hypothetical protein VB013_03760 [Anaerolineaceae bacterium]|nr:hypothetical protein [Anaerolineaceae bacterium]
MIAEVLLQRTRANNVLPVYEQFVIKFETPIILANSSIEQISSVIFPLGLSWRAKYIHQLGIEILNIGNKIPNHYEDLVKLPCIGDYVASAYLIFHLQQPGTIIDVNIVRFLCRLANLSYDGETRRKQWFREMAKSLTPIQKNKEFNYAILDFSMIQCKKNPNCDLCPMNKLCLYEGKNGPK